MSLHKFGDPVYTIPHGKSKNCLKEIIHNAFQQKNGSIRFKCIPLGYQKAYFVNLIEKNKRLKHATQKNKWSIYWSFLSTTYLLNLEVDSFNKLSAFLWERTVCLSLPTSFYFHMNRGSFRHLSKTRRSKKPDYLISLSDILMMFFP